MGLINISHSEMTQSMIDLQSDLLKNPYYLFSDKKGTPTEYYNLNTTRSTLDEALEIPYSNLGSDSPLRFNLVHGFYLYGLDRVQYSVDNGELGLESGEITGDAIILPDTITPYPGDYFSIIMVKQKYLFKVIEAHPDTFNNGANYWRISYVLQHLNDERIKELVVGEFNFVSGNVGTNYSPIIQKKKFDVAKALDDAAVNLKRHFKALYYNNKVQTFTFIYLYLISPNRMSSDFFYDPYMIEFVIKNKVLANTGDKYEYIDHKTNLRADFPIKYNHSIWKVIENREMAELPTCKSQSNAQYICDPGTIFGTRYERYFELTYAKPNAAQEIYAPSLDILDPQAIGHILNNQLFDQSSKYAKYNILVKYFNNTAIGVEDIIPLEQLDETDNTAENYFLIPMLIYCIEVYIKELIAAPQKSSTF